MSAGATIEQIPIDRIRVRAGHRSSDYSDVEVQAFAKAIRATGGIEHPLIVRRIGAGHEAYELVAGGLRLAAAESLGWPTVPCRIRDVTERVARVVALVEDLAGKTEKTLPLGWALLEAIEETGWTQAELAATTNTLPSKISEAIKAGRAVPEGLLMTVACEKGVPPHMAKSLGREDLRRLSKMRDPAARRAALARALTVLIEKAPVDGREDPPLRPILLAGGGVRVDPMRIGALGPLELLMTVLSTVWLLSRAWAGGSRRFAGLRAAKPKPAPSRGPGAQAGTGVPAAAQPQAEAP